jgi:cobalt-zinc-cadmium efflux system outer membrane protein
MFGDLLSAGVTVSLPIFQGTRQRPMIDARTADRNRTRIEREERRRTLVAALDGDLADHVMHHDQWRRAIEVLVPTAEKRADLELKSYAAGRAGFDDLRVALTDLADAKLQALEREALVARDGARIQITYGADQ